MALNFAVDGQVVFAGCISVARHDIASTYIARQQDRGAARPQARQQRSGPFRELELAETVDVHSLTKLYTSPFISVMHGGHHVGRRIGHTQRYYTVHTQRYYTVHRRRYLCRHRNQREQRPWWDLACCRRVNLEPGPAGPCRRQARQAILPIRGQANHARMLRPGLVA